SVTIENGNTFASTSGVEILDIKATNNLSNKIANDVRNIKVVGVLTLAAADLSAHDVALEIDGGRTKFDAGTTGNNDYSNISVANSATLEMTVTSNLDISSQSGDDIAVLTHLQVNTGVNFSLNADQTNDALDISGSSTTADVTIKSTTTDANNVFTNIVNSGSGNIIYDVVTNVDKTGEASTILGDIDTININNGSSLDVDFSQLSNITTLTGDGVLNVATTGNTTNLSGILNIDTYTGEINIADTAGSDTIIGSSYGDNITISTGVDTVDGADGADRYIYSGNANADNLTDTGSSGTDTIVVEATADLRALNTMSGIEELNVNGNFTATINKTIADGIGIFSGADGTSSVSVELTNGEDLDISSKTVSNLDSVTMNIASGGANSTLVGTDSSRNIITVVDGVNTITGGALADTLTGGSGVDTFKTKVAHLTSSDTINGGGSTDILEFIDGGSISDSAFTNVSSIETVQFSNSDTNMTLGVFAGDIGSIVGGSGNDSVSLNSGGSYGSISGVETLNVNRTIDLSGKVTDVKTINVGTGGNLTLDADDFLATLLVNNDDTVAIHDVTTTNMNNLDLTGSTGTTTITTSNGANVDFSDVTFAGTINIQGTAGNEIISMDEGVNTIDGAGGTNELIIKAGSSDSYGSTTITNFQTLSVNETVDLGSRFDSNVANINIANGKTLSVDSSDLDERTINLDGGRTKFDAGTTGNNDYSNISVANSATLEMTATSNLDISSQSGDDIAV
ncbi:MAG: hypothetical protein U9R65_12730, partial [Pseudomonadota bacterium]|nr:hypothetical protein [Pseudomonadota bacterium]